MDTLKIVDVSEINKDLSFISSLNQIEVLSIPHQQIILYRLNFQV